MQPDSPFTKGCKKSLMKNSWLVSIHHEEPITVTRLLEYINHLRETNVLNVTVTLSKRPHPSTTELYQEFRMRFDQMRPITNSAAFVRSKIAKFAIHSLFLKIFPEFVCKIWYKLNSFMPVAHLLVNRISISL